MKIPPSDDLVKEFTDRHHIQVGEYVAREVLPIRASSLANILVTSSYASLGEEVLADPAVGLLLNMLHRNFSLADGAIVAFATGCGGPAERMRAYFDHYFAAVDKQV